MLQQTENSLDIQQMLEQTFGKATTEELYAKSKEVSSEVIDNLVEMVKNPNTPDKEINEYLERGITNMAVLGLYIMHKEISNENIETEVKMYVTGIRAEVATIVAFEKAGYTVTRASTDEDLNKGVDLFVTPPGQEEEGEIWAIQLKNKAQATKIIAKELKTGAISDESAMPSWYEPSRDEDKAVEEMLGYLNNKVSGLYQNHKNFEDHLVRPLMVYMPSNANKPYDNAGRPKSEMVDQLVEAITLANKKATASQKSKNTK